MFEHPNSCRCNGENTIYLDQLRSSTAENVVKGILVGNTWNRVKQQLKQSRPKVRQQLF